MSKEYFVTALKKLRDLQKRGAYTLCPICGSDLIATGAETNSDEVSVCKACFEREEGRKNMNAPKLDYAFWYVFNAHGDFKDVDAKTAKREIEELHIPTLIDIYDSNRDVPNAEEKMIVQIRMRCKGTQTITLESGKLLTVYYPAKTGSVVARIKRLHDRETYYATDIVGISDSDSDE